MTKHYRAIVRGQVPSDLDRKVTEAHSMAIRHQTANAVYAPIGEGTEPAVVEQAHVELPRARRRLRGITRTNYAGHCEKPALEDDTKAPIGKVEAEKS